jgi:hypothetical protein
MFPDMRKLSGVTSRWIQPNRCASTTHRIISAMYHLAFSSERTTSYREVEIIPEVAALHDILLI